MDNINLVILEETANNTSKIVLIVMLVLIIFVLLFYLLWSFGHIDVKNGYVCIIKDKNKKIKALNSGKHWIFPFVESKLMTLKESNNNVKVNVGLLNNGNKNCVFSLMYDIVNPVNFYIVQKNDKERFDFDLKLYVKQVLNKIEFTSFESYDIDKINEFCLALTDLTTKYGIKITDVDLMYN